MLLDINSISYGKNIILSNTLIRLKRELLVYMAIIGKERQLF